jgi:uncharacterized membrane protein
MPRKKNSPDKLNLLSGIQKLLISMGIAGVVYGLLSLTAMDIQNRIILSWDTFCMGMICFGWILFISTDEKELCDVCEQQDEGLKAIFGIVLTGVFVSLFGTILLLTGKSGSDYGRIMQMMISLSPVLLSWILLHTTFTIRYAHLYHDQNRLGTGTKVGGLDFPGKSDPDYLDFAYFSFVVGMTFQVSDVQVTSRAIRRLVLMHSLISFVFNTIIVALTINSIAGLRD